MSTVWKFSGPPQNWITALTLKKWAFNNVSRNVRQWNKIQPEDIAIFHSTHESLYANSTPSIIGYGIIGLEKYKKDNYWWIQEKNENLNIWPYVVDFKKIFTFSDLSNVDLTTAIEDKTESQISEEVDLLLLNAISIKYLENEARKINPQSMRFPVNGSVLRLNEPYKAIILDKVRQTYEISIGSDDVSNNSWSDDENRIIVEDYFNMLDDELAGIPYNKSEHRDLLVPRLKNRSIGSIAFKHQNISAILAQLGLPYIRGYKPRYHIQSNLITIVERYIQESDNLNELFERYSENVSQSVGDIDFVNVLESPPDLLTTSEDITKARDFKTIKIDYSRREASNRSLGLKGEEFVIKYESHRLSNLGRTDLAERIKHVSREKGDGAGYDVLSFEDNGQEIFIEVKTTKLGKDMFFYMSQVEKDFLVSNAKQYYLYRVFNFDSKPKLYKLNGLKLLNCNFRPCQYIITV